ncbi:hypothetical protein, partial [Geobacillus zalihae]|uniref:hypothetical protein n=1 Tax=Geobacillus zalihae TaxID=213419 RepID=UPI001A99F215
RHHDKQKDDPKQNKPKKPSGQHDPHPNMMINCFAIGKIRLLLCRKACCLASFKRRLVTKCNATVMQL